MTNRDSNLEKQNQQRVEARKGELPDVEQVNRPRKEHPMDKDRQGEIAERGRVSETGAGRGLEHQGH